MKQYILKITKNVKAALKAVNSPKARKNAVTQSRSIRRTKLDIYLEQAYMDELAYREF